MKKLFFFLFFLVLSPVALAQSYSDYLQAAKKHLRNGNVEKARINYNIYKDLTGKKDAYIEGQLNPVKAETPRKKSKTPLDKAPFAQQGQSVPTSLTFTVNGVSFRMVYVQGGTFRMGSNDSEAEDDEQPVHSVTLSDYYIGETEVTQQLWRAVMGSNPSYFTGDSQRPVEQVSWEDCQTFIRKLNALTGKKFRLPTEAEWEYAARGGNKSRGYKYCGSNILSEVAWDAVNSYDKGSSHPDYGTHPVKQKRSNELGLYDMSGNVWEWCQDWYDSDYYSQSPSYNPTGPGSGAARVNRGGSWCGSAWYCHVAHRLNYYPGYRGNNLGLRLAL
jgi:formylglycine-generating enzyme required for sulfatase activity